MTDHTGSMNGKICLVTGGSSGIGAVTARELARQGAQVVIVSRNAEHNFTAVEHIQQVTGSPSVAYITADLSNQAQVRHAAETFKEQYARLDVLVNNAGAWFMQRKLSADGIEMTFALNHLAYFLLTHLLMDRLRASPAGRIVNVSSNAHLMATINFDELQSRRGFAGYGAYTQSKLANVLFTYELARRLEGSSITANALHPGFVASGFGKNNGRIMAFFMKLAAPFGLDVEQGAQTSIYLATAPEVAMINGKYFHKKRAVSSSAASYDAEAARRLWEISLAMTGLKETIGGVP